ncbi:jg3410 [Pararge aegeria aegeria]|uniref:Jg3410 protein n=1 Tax=Pararge aegeria aegeria TaxID=348720 RepID=A0A8S4RSZ8_9NEOP|nr:jg3410 [Pararge aegeria aegeria]
MAGIKNIVAIMVLSALLAICTGQTGQGGPQTSQGGPHQNEGRARRQAEGVTTEDGFALNPLNWTTCDVTVIPKISCHDCNTRVICKPIGGLLKTCDNPARPHCNLGICSAVPSLACA